MWKSEVTLLKGDPENGKLDQISFPDMNVTLFGWSFIESDLKNVYEKPLFKRISGICNKVKGKFNILIAHGGDDKNIPINYKELSEKGYDYVALGHIHKAEILCDNMAYAGSLVPLDRTETGVHGYIYGETNQDKIVFWQKEYKKKEYVLREIVSCENDVQGAIEEKIINCVQNEEGNYIYSFRVTGTRERSVEYDFTKNALARINARCNNKVLKIEDATCVNYDYVSLAEQNYIIREFIDNVEMELTDKEVQKYALEYGVDAILRGMEIEENENY